MRYSLAWKEHYKPISNLLTLDFCVLTIAIAEERPPPRVFVYVTITCVALGGDEVGRLISGNFRKNPHIDLMNGSAGACEIIKTICTQQK